MKMISMIMISVCGSIDMPVLLSARLWREARERNSAFISFTWAIYDCATITNAYKADAANNNERKDYLSKTSDTRTP